MRLAALLAVVAIAACGGGAEVHGTLEGNTTFDLGPAIEVDLIATCGDTVVRGASDLRGDFSVTITLPEVATEGGTIECTLEATMLAFSTSTSATLAVGALEDPAPVTRVGEISLDPQR